ncbi:MAG: hypothetical protein JWL61_5450 [Gemmatimonadetes bacterium]|nr:hypothetical protein [Gemmatimonadota bacterium]
MKECAKAPRPLLPNPVIEIGDGRGSGVELHARDGQAIVSVFVSPSDYGEFAGRILYVAVNRYVAFSTWDSSKKRSARHFIHREILPDIDGLQVDHANRIRLDNRRGNLRRATPSLNTANRERPHHAKPPSSRFRGVTARQGKWQAGLKVHRRFRFLGLFKNEEDAARAYDRAAVQAFGAFAVVNYADGEQAAPAQ